MCRKNTVFVLHFDVGSEWKVSLDADEVEDGVAVVETDFGQTDFGQSDFGQSDFGQSDYGQTDFGQR